MCCSISIRCASALLPSIIGEFSQRYPDVSLDVTSALSKHLLSSNQREQFDLILALLPENTQSNMPVQDINTLDKTMGDAKIEVIRKDQLMWVGDPRQPLHDEILPLVLAPEGCIYRSRVIDLLKQQTHAWKITYTNPDFYGIMSAIKQGLGITALAHSIVPDELEIVRDKRLPKLGKINICLINRDSQHPQVSQTLGDYIKARITK